MAEELFDNRPIYVILCLLSNAREYLMKTQISTHLAANNLIHLGSVSLGFDSTFDENMGYGTSFYNMHSNLSAS